mmetsp:Transcript_20431/g.44255  ORF Transcript_20431/g.44255 Transcript_20431/m.44255 type:complete len:1572 (-) Transcript_20431:548-5263(-)
MITERVSETLINEDLEARQSRWGSLMSELEDEWDVESDDGNDDGKFAAAPGRSLNGMGGMTNGGISSLGHSSDNDGNIEKNGMAVFSVGTAPSSWTPAPSRIGAALGRMRVTPPAAAAPASAHPFQFQPSHPSPMDGNNNNKPFSFPSWSTASAVTGGVGSHRGSGSVSVVSLSRGPSSTLSVHSNNNNNGSGSAAEGVPTLRDWIVSHGRSDAVIKRDDRENSVKSQPVIGNYERRKYLETSVQILHSLVGKIIGGYSGASKTDGGEEVYAHPNFITIDNIIVRKHTLVGGEEVSADFVASGDSIFYNDGQVDDNINKKYLAMDALGRLAYQVFVRGEGPDISKFSKGHGKDTMDSLSNALVLHGENKNRNDAKNNAIDLVDEENEIMGMLRKNVRTITSEQFNQQSSGIIPAMLEALVPFPLCRLVSDLLDDDDETSMFGRSERSFSYFSDVLADLKQMVDDPEEFLHNSNPDRWKLVFGKKLYGRDGDTKKFMDAADRVATTRDDPIFNGLNGLAGRRKEVIMVSGHSGSGKSRLVRLGGALLEKNGWRFLRCKFDRVARPEPLSIIAYAFDEYFGSFASCPTHGTHPSPFPSDSESCICAEAQEIRQRLESIICPEGLAILAKHIPSLRLVAKNVPLLSKIMEVNEAIIHTLFGQLMQVLSSKRTPILFFIDDLQWVDPLSLALLTELVKGAHPDLILEPSLRDCERASEEDVNVMFVGSYRCNEVDDDHPLARVLKKFDSDSSVNLTNISLSGFTVDTLNEMLSESLRMPVRRVRSLSEMVMQKTDGQPLHVIEFVQALTMDNLLTHSFVRGWEWDADSIDICPITDSVAELFALKLRRLPRDIVVGLQIVSIFGSQIDQNVLAFVADYDGEDSVDITEAIRVATREGLVERASSLVSFAHDMIQKATIDSIGKEDLVVLLRKLAAAFIRNASAVGQLDSVLYVVVDLINRIGCDATPSPKQRALFAELNSRAASKAIKVPDFAGAAKYAENGITFLHEGCWEAQYSLSLSLYETAVLSHFSSLSGDRDVLTKRINAVFEHAKDFSDLFKTHCVWIKLLSMKDLTKAIAESLHALERLGEPLDLTHIDSHKSRDELIKRRDQFAGDRKKKFLSSNRLSDENKARVMKIYSSLIVYYHQQKSFLGSYIGCQMIKMSMDHGHCEHSVFGAAAFACSLVNILDDIDEGSDWGGTALSLMNMYDKEVLMPSIHGSLYGIVFIWKEPIQATLEPLARGIRLSYATGNVEFAMVNTIYYSARSFNCGKNIRVLTTEVEALARQHRNNFGSDASSDTPVYSPLLQFYLTPLYNVLRVLAGENDDQSPTSEEEETSFPLDRVKLVNNDDILKVAVKTDQLACFHTILSYETAKAFMCRDMEKARKCTDLYFDKFATKDLRLMYTAIYNVFYEGLVSFYFTRLTGEENCRTRAENAYTQMREWSFRSDWNFENKLLLIEAELYYTLNNYDKASICYEASIKSAREHKFIHEEAIANELAGNFFYETGHFLKAESFYAHSIKCFKKWGGFAVARRVESIVLKRFGADSWQLCPIDYAASSTISSKENLSKKRQSRS